MNLSKEDRIVNENKNLIYDDEKTISLVDLCFYLLSKWKLMVIAAIILAIIAGGFTYMKSSKASENSGEVLSLEELEAVGHRVVHGGNFYSHSVKISARALIEIEELSDLVGLERIKLITPDGPANYLRTVLNQMDKEEFEFFIKYHLATCERRELIGAAAHTVDILRKV